MKDKIFKGLLFAAALAILVLTAGVIYVLVKQSLDVFHEYGVFGFIFNAEWDPRPETEEYGAWSFIIGTLFTAFFALLLCIPFSLPVALFNGEYFKGYKISSFVSSVVDLLAGIPSIVYGLWGFYTLRPIVIQLGVNAQGFEFSCFDRIGRNDYSVCFVAECRIFIDDSRHSEGGCVQFRGYSCRNNSTCELANGKFGYCGCVYSCIGTSTRRNNGCYHAYREHHQRAHLVARYGKYDGERHSQSIWRGRWLEAECSYWHRFVVVSYNGCY